MNIVSESRIKKVKESPEFITSIVDQIFLICKEDKSFTIKDKIKSANNQLEILEDKVRKQNILLEQAMTLKENINSKITSIEEDSFRTKVILLESLGSEI